MTDLINGEIRKHGSDITLIRHDGTQGNTFRGFIQPLRYKNKMYQEGTPTDAGIADSGYYTLIAECGCGISDSVYYDSLYDGNRRYHIQRTDTVAFDGRTVYVWAILKEEKNR